MTRTPRSVRSRATPVGVGGGRRGEVLAVLRDSPDALSIVEIATRLRLHPNTVRFHLEALVEAGQAERVEHPRTGPGRPPQMFGLGIGRLVFRALNSIEIIFAATILTAMIIDPPSSAIITALLGALAALLIQLAVVRPRLTRRSDAVLAGHDAPRSRGHYAYVALEALKVIALLAGGILLLVHSVS
jgi:DNA-binding transcriptional ArsR family regulator